MIISTELEGLEDVGGVIVFQLGDLAGRTVEAKSVTDRKKK